MPRQHLQFFPQRQNLHFAICLFTPLFPLTSLPSPRDSPRFPRYNIYTVNSTTSTAHFTSMNHAQYRPWDNGCILCIQEPYGAIEDCEIDLLYRHQFVDVWQVFACDIQMPKEGIQIGDIINIEIVDVGWIAVHVVIDCRDGMVVAVDGDCAAAHFVMACLVLGLFRDGLFGLEPWC
ncbi:hypothetical protein FVEG_17230 [Fusarium verticillioides 7600]|uniref:Uncharacterized protein n=1 Tax=Gibberella moniliformis (strain M3125 / FGSC 7600) TaxID=334819 RepID=W7NC46_GIBM7|nr:hypothetical protein FVEG_17230 [Fusarium verticillioides 7600]EWG54037.1 hypothetical protein FVEG_17230 [Fusarium verticillioides 7600]